MSISKINNSFHFSDSQNNSAKSLRSFKGTENQDEHASQISPPRKLSNKELYNLASYDADKRFSEVSKKSVKTLFIAVPLLDTTITGLLKKGNLSDKLLKSSKTLGKWGAVFVATAGVLGIKKFMNNRFEGLDNFDKKRGAIAFGVDLGALYLTFTSLLKSKNNLSKHFNNIAPKLSKSIKDFSSGSLKEAINKSFVNKKLVQPAETFMTKRPHHAAVNKLAASLLVPVMGLAVILRVRNEGIKRQENVRNNFIALNFLNELTSQMPKAE